MSQETVEIPKIILDSNDQLVITASATSSQHDFDFYEGKWQLHNKKLKSILTGSTQWTEFQSTQEMYRMLNGLGNIDNYLTELDGKPFEGMSLRLFNPATNLWSIYWADSNRGSLDPAVVGSFENKIGHFFTRDIYKNKKIIVVFRWDARDQDKPVWSQAFSDDEGHTWEWNWFMYFTKFNAPKCLD